MGLSSSKTTTVSKPSDQQVRAGNTLDAAFQAQMPKITAVSDQIGGLIPQMMARYQQGNPALRAANDYVTQTLGRQGGNPLIDQMIAQSGGDMANAINASVGTRGITGGSVQQRILANELSKNALNLRYQDFNADQQRRMQAAGMAPQLAAGDAIGIAPLLSVAQFATGTPLNAASQYASGMGGLFGNTGSQTTTQSPNWGMALLQGASNAAGAAMLSDARAKENIKRVGQTDAGLPIYTFNYKGDVVTQMGVMAQDVADLQPRALGPLTEGGYMTVRYGEVR